jgi:hypothetical protein
VCRSGSGSESGVGLVGWFCLFCFGYDLTIDDYDTLLGVRCAFFAWVGLGLLLCWRLALAGNWAQTERFFMSIQRGDTEPQSMMIVQDRAPFLSPL